MNIYIEETGGGMGQTFFHLYTVNKSCEKGHGIQYNAVCKPHIFAWCHPCNDNMLPEDLKQKFMYSFKHGSSDIYINSNLLKSGIGLFDILRDKRNYQYNWVSRKDTLIQKKIEALEINTKEDVLKNKDLLSSNPISHGVVCKILSAFGIPQTKAYNGEIGIAAMQDYIMCSAIMAELKNDSK